MQLTGKELSSARVTKLAGPRSNLIALLGKKDVPTDGVEDYCRFLGRALETNGFHVDTVRVSWEEMGWIRACGRLWQESRKWKGMPVLAQYTALMWSRRGFPLAFLIVLLMLKVRGTHLITVFHDVAPYPGKRLVDRIRRACQHAVLRGAYGLARACVLPLPVEQAGWLPRPATKAIFIPVGPNVPVKPASAPRLRQGHAPKTIAVFTVTDGGDISQEVAAIVFAASTAAQHVRQVRLVTLGRGSFESEPNFRNALAGSTVEFQALGVLPAEEIARVLKSCDVSLFVRGRITTQRGSAIASIACFLPLVGYAGSQLAAPLTEAGVVGVRWGDQQALAEAVVMVLTNDDLWRELHERNQRAYEKYFSWEVIAGKFAELFDHASI